MAYFHVWFATKHRMWLLEGQLLEAVREEIAKAAADHEINLIEYEAIIDHVHLLLDVEGNDLATAMKHIKGVSARRLFQQFPELRSGGTMSSLWQAGYGHKLVPMRGVDSVRRYIKAQWQRMGQYE
jgi:putative transposase